jgi:hypothetical protein
MGPHASGWGGTTPFETASADTSGAHRRSLFGALLADCTAPFRITRHLSGLSIGQRPLRTVGGVGYVNAGRFEPIANLVGASPIPIATRIIAAP